ncbi:hypothetical protein HW555_011587, partial [Spodoptera exigua]
YGSLNNYYVNAKEVAESQYPWIARVIHSRSSYVPHICTAVCIADAIFITASRCIYTLKVNYTRILHNTKFYNALAFVVPSVPTPQAFDDIGFVVVHSKNSRNSWRTIKPFNAVNRTDGAFRWFSKVETSYGKNDYKVVGYAMLKGIDKIRAPERQYHLTELNVIVSLDLCHRTLAENLKLKVYRLPCYHSCTYKQFLNGDSRCKNYHGVEGGAIINTRSNQLLGIATWGYHHAKFEFPVGFSVVNSRNFYNDLRCARRIRDDNGLRIVKGYYQKLCDK